MKSDSSAAATATTRRSRRAARAADAQVAEDVIAEVTISEQPPLSRRARRRVGTGATPVVEDPAPIAPEFDAPLAPAADVPTPSEEQQKQQDAFAAAAEAFSFTGEQIRVVDEESAAEREQPTRRERSAASKALNTPFRRFAAATASAGALVAVGLIAAGATLPFATGTGALTDVAAASGSETETVEVAALPETQLQAYVAGENVETNALTRVEGYEASTQQNVAFAAAAASGINTANAVFENDIRADIQWPFIVGTGMSSPYGMRWGRLHEGIDFVPGEGAPIQSIADGVVRIATEAGGAYGVNVYVDHIIDGQLVSSHYAHMQYGSLQVQAGDTVKVGDVLGNVGNTGRSYGAHLHFEVIVNGTAIDPMPWMQEHGNRHFSDEEREAARAAIVDQLGGAFLTD